MAGVLKTNSDNSPVCVKLEEALFMELKKILKYLMLKDD